MFSSKKGQCPSSAMSPIISVLSCKIFCSLKIKASGYSTLSPTNCSHLLTLGTLFFIHWKPGYLIQSLLSNSYCQYSSIPTSTNHPTLQWVNSLTVNKWSMVYPISITNFYTKSHTLWTLLPSIQNSSASQILIYTLPTSIWFAEVFLSYQGFFLFCFFALVGGERLIEIYNPFIPSHSTCALLSSLLSLSNHVHNFYYFLVNPKFLCSCLFCQTHLV